MDSQSELQLASIFFPGLRLAFLDKSEESGKGLVSSKMLSWKGKAGLCGWVTALCIGGELVPVGCYRPH